MYQIEILQYPIIMRLGFFPYERRAVQEVYVTLKASLQPTVQPGLHDDLERTLDYGQVMQMLDELLTNKEVKLVETVVELIGGGILECFKDVATVEVSVEKRTLPKAIAKGAHVRVSRTFVRS